MFTAIANLWMNDYYMIDIKIDLHRNLKLARWKVCMKSINIANSGKCTLDSHMKADSRNKWSIQTCHEAFIAERIVSDHVTSIGGVIGVDINKELTSCRASHSRYTVS